MTNDTAEPQDLDDIVGHEGTLATILRAFSHNRAHHAYLFTGPPGVGKRTVAVILARSLLCEEGRVGYPCGHCGPCLRTHAKTHPDLIELGTEDVPSIKIDDVRNTTRGLSFRSFEGGRRLVLIARAERLTDEAANALLKTLEEPPPDSTFILTTSNRAQLLPTIVSRCQPLVFPPMRDEQVAIIMARQGCEGDDVSIASRFSGGSPGHAVELLSRPVFQNRRDLLSEFLNLSVVNALSFGDWTSNGLSEKGRSLADQRVQTRQVLECLRVLVRDLTILLGGGASERLVNRDAADLLEAPARRLTWEGISGMLAGLREAEEAMAVNVTPRLVLERLAARTVPILASNDGH